jgi:hypothetical protein
MIFDEICMLQRDSGPSDLPSFTAAQFQELSCISPRRVFENGSRSFSKNRLPLSLFSKKSHLFFKDIRGFPAKFQSASENNPRLLREGGETVSPMDIAPQYALYRSIGKKNIHVTHQIAHSSSLGPRIAHESPPHASGNTYAKLKPSQRVFKTKTQQLPQRNTGIHVNHVSLGRGVGDKKKLAKPLRKDHATRKCCIRDKNVTPSSEDSIGKPFMRRHFSKKGDQIFRLFRKISKGGTPTDPPSVFFFHGIIPIEEIRELFKEFLQKLGRLHLLPLFFPPELYEESGLEDSRLPPRE